MSDCQLSMIYSCRTSSGVCPHHSVSIYFSVHNSSIYDNCERVCRSLYAVDDIKSIADYSTNGEVAVVCCIIVTKHYFATLFQWVMTDARHDSTANAFHSTVVCLSGRSVIMLCGNYHCHCHLHL